MRVLLTWGSGVDYQTSIAAFREGVGRWRVERVYNGGDLGAYSGAWSRRRQAYLSSEAGAELDALLRDPALYGEPIYAEGHVPEGATISIRIEGNAHDAVFSGVMPGPGLTGRVIDVLDEKNTPRFAAPEGSH